MPHPPGGKINASNLNIEGLNPAISVADTDLFLQFIAVTCEGDPQ